MSVAIEFRCTRCGKLLRTGEENVGRPAACPACGERIEVPPISEPPPIAAAAPVHTTEPAGRQRKRPLRPHRGGLILAFGILSWMTCFLFGVAAWALGVDDLRAIRAGEMDPSGESLTRAGLILGAVHVILSLVALFAVIGFAALAIAIDFD